MSTPKICCCHIVPSQFCPFHRKEAEEAKKKPYLHVIGGVPLKKHEAEQAFWEISRILEDEVRGNKSKSMTTKAQWLKKYFPDIYKEAKRDSVQPMNCIKEGSPPAGKLWRGWCRKCHSVFEDLEENVRRGKVDRCPREQYEFAHRDCPQCGAAAGSGVILYPVT